MRRGLQIAAENPDASLSGLYRALLPRLFELLLGALPVEGVSGKLIAGELVNYLNLQGAWLVAGVLAAAGLYFASAVSFEVIFEFLQARWRNLSWLHDRWRDKRERRAEERSETEEEESLPDNTPATDFAEAEAEFGPRPEPTAENPHPRPAIVPGSFVVLVVGR